MIEIPITQARKSLFLCLVFNQILHLCFLKNLKKKDKVAEYLDIADKTDNAV